MITVEDMLDQVVRTLDPFHVDFDCTAIVNEIHNRHGLCDIDKIGAEEYWEIVQRHDTSDSPHDPRVRTHGAEFEANDVHPCAFGRCTDPAAHAEGAHDL